MIKRYAGDIETPGLHPVRGRDEIFGLALFDGKKTRVYERDEIYKARNILEDGDVQKVFHNFGFDGFWLLHTMGIKAINIADTMLQEQIIVGDNLFNPKSATDEQRIVLDVSLFWCLKRYKLPVHSKALQSSFASKPMNQRLTAKEKEYMCGDVEQLLNLQSLQDVMIKKLDLTQLAWLENKLVEVTVKMKCHGLGVDLEAWKRIEVQNIQQRNQIAKTMPPRVANWNSHVQVKRYFTSIGIPIASLTEINEDFVKKYNNPVLNKYVIMRDLSTQISKYGSNFLYIKNDKEERNAVDPDGRIRASFFQILNTGRYSVSSPPIHGLPREVDDEAPVQWPHRGAFVPAKGKRFVSGDFSSQELGTAAAASGEQLWIKALQRGEDPLSLMASIMFPNWFKNTEKGCTFPKKCKCKLHKKDRQTSKEVTYGIMYGAWEGTIAPKIGRSLEETKQLMKKNSKATPKLVRWSKGNAAYTIKYRESFSANVFKRRRTVRDPLEWMVRNVGYNNPIQAAAADMMKLAMINIHAKYDIAFTWHDDLILEVPTRVAKQAAKHLKKVMEAAADYCTGVKGLIRVEPSILKSLSKK